MQSICQVFLISDVDLAYSGKAIHVSRWAIGSIPYMPILLAGNILAKVEDDSQANMPYTINIQVS
jgi:hypothetical protein